MSENNRMLSPRPLKEGDQVAFVATARKVSPEEMEPAKKLLQSWGLQVVEPEHLYDSDHQMAGTDATRAAMLQWALDCDDIKAIFCVRGGYGTVKIIDLVDFSHFALNSKWIVGYSDVTVLHSHIQRTLGIETLHAIMPINIPTDADSRSYPAIDTLHNALWGNPFTYVDPFIDGTAHPLNRAGYGEGVLMGGNLSVLYSLLESPSSIDTQNAILLIEDLDEYLYHIDRMMAALKRAGKLAHLRGLVVGALSDMHDNTIPFGMTAEEIVWEAVKEYQYPVFFNGKFGHIGTQNMSLTLGKKVFLEVTPEGDVTLSDCPILGH